MQYEIDLNEIARKLEAGEFTSLDLQILENLSKPRVGNRESFEFWTKEARVKLEGAFVSECYALYLKYCEINKVQPLKIREFSIAVRKKYGLKSKIVTYKGKSHRMYVKIPIDYMP